MGLRFADSGNHWTAGLQKWTSIWQSNAFGSTASGRNGGRGITGSNGAMYKQLDSQGTWILGAAFSLGNGNTNWPLLAVLDSGTIQIQVQMIQASGAVGIYRGTTLLAQTSGNTMLQGSNIWQYLEFKVVIGSGTSGSYSVRLNGTVILSNSATNTQNTSNATADQVALGVPLNGTAADFYACDGTGSTNNTFLGDIKVQYLAPTADGANTAWTPNSGTAHYSRVNETTAGPDDDTSYNSTATAGNIDTYQTGAPSAGTIYGVQQILRHRIDDAGLHTIAPVIRAGGTNYIGTAVASTASYQTTTAMQETNPNTSAAWVVADFGAGNAEFGVKMVS